MVSWSLYFEDEFDGDECQVILSEDNSTPYAPHAMLLGESVHQCKNVPIAMVRKTYNGTVVGANSVCIDCLQLVEPQLIGDSYVLTYLRERVS